MNYNVLITAASRRVKLVKLFTEPGLRFGKVVAVDCDSTSPALQFADEIYTVPMVEDKNYFTEINKIIEIENIKLVIPTIDIELFKWAERYEYYKDRGVHISISDPKTISVCNTKMNTYWHFNQNNLPWFAYSREMISPDSNPEDLAVYTYPFFSKPNIGRGSLYAHKVNNFEEYKFYKSQCADLIAQEYLNGKEFSLDCFFDRDGNLINFVPRWRIWVRAGVTDKGETFFDPRFEGILKKITSKLHFRGVINFQGKITSDNEIKFFEINPRFPGGIGLSYEAGLIVNTYLNNELEGIKLIPSMKYRKGVFMSCYEEQIFL